MKVHLYTEDELMAIDLRDSIISSLKGTIDGVSIDTWSYINSKDGYDILFHNPDQYVTDNTKNVLFRLQIDGACVVLTTAWWTKNPEPTYEMFCLHTGRLVEMLLRYFSEKYIKLSILP